jgi:asparagine synthase (glutamine-hydrolysing)
MCGIVGSIHTNHPIDPVLFQRQCETLRHRGPDDHGVWFSADGCVALGNRRLAIQDLTPAGHMPMSDPSGQVWITFNGEIYNFESLRIDLETRGHTFQSGSDTEVILAAYLEWGTECLAHLNGMFAFAIYDGRWQGVDYSRSSSAVDYQASGPCIFMARDRAGEKPLYYWHHIHGLAFASELKALMADPTFPRRLSLSALNMLLAFGYVPGEMCILEGVKKLPPAHALIYDIHTGNLCIWRYWALPGMCAREKAMHAEECVDELANLLRESVRLRLVADVPVGVLLSGGIDSSLITAMAAHCSTRAVKTFTITFPGYAAYDEAPYARRVAQYFGTDHHELVAEPTTVDLLPELARCYDEPIADSSLVPTYLVSYLTRQHVTVALGGDGGDELFAGYLHYSLTLRRQRWRSRIPQPLRAVMAHGARRWLPVGFKGRNFLSSLGGDLGEGVVSAGLLFDATARRFLFAEPVRQSLNHQLLEPERHKLGLWQHNAEPVDQMTRLDFASYLPDNILAKVDRASMALSLEVRAPWLDRHIVEFAFGRVHGALKAVPRERKLLPRRLAQRLLPSGLDLNRKQGFSLPLASWLKGEWGYFMTHVLSEADSNLFARDALHRLVQGQRYGFSNTSRLFALTMFELWRREYRVDLP